jgi:X8 domain
MPPPTCTPAIITYTSNSSGTIKTGHYTLSPNFVSIPNARLCSCMFQTLACVADSNRDEAANQESYHKYCSGSEYPDQCRGVKASSKNGYYGSYMSCNLTERTSYLFNQLYLSNGQDESSCKSIGGTVKEPVKEETLGKDCNLLMDQVGPNATGIVKPIQTLMLGAGDGSSGLSQKTKAGVAVGIALFIFFLIAVLVGFCIWSRRRKMSRAASGAKMAEFDTAIELPDSERIEELEDNEKKELGDEDKIHEIGDEILVELPGDEVPELHSGHPR